MGKTFYGEYGMYGMINITDENWELLIASLHYLSPKMKGFESFVVCG